MKHSRLEIRMKSVKGILAVESLNQKSGPKSIKVTYTFFADPEGSLSPSLVNKNILVLHCRILMGLKNMILTLEYKLASGNL